MPGLLVCPSAARILKLGVVGVAQLVRALACGAGGRGFKTHHPPQVIFARMAELVDAPDLGSGTARCVGSSPIPRTKTWGETSAKTQIKRTRRG